MTFNSPVSNSSRPLNRSSEDSQASSHRYLWIFHRSSTRARAERHSWKNLVFYPPQKILVVTWPYVRSSVRPSVRTTGNRCEMLHWALSIYQKLWETYMERSIEWRTCSTWHKFHSFMLSSPKFKKMAEISPWIAWNCLAKTLKWNMHFHWMVSKGITGLPFQFSSYIADSGVDPSRLRVLFLTFTADKFQVFI